MSPSLDTPAVPAPEGGADSGSSEPDPGRSPGLGSARLDERSLSRLKWGCRRGLLENDLFIERFFKRHEHTLTTWQAAGLQQLMDLADNDLLDLLLRRREPEGALARPEVIEVLGLLRERPAAA